MTNRSPAADTCSAAWYSSRRARPARRAASASKRRPFQCTTGTFAPAPSGIQYRSTLDAGPGSSPTITSRPRGRIVAVAGVPRNRRGPNGSMPR